MELKSWLQDAKNDVSSLDAELIALEAVAPRGADRSWLVAHDDLRMTSDELRFAEQMLARRIDGEPMAYILGVKEFYGREFRVTPAVLIPRPETESLIALAKGLDLPKRARFIEVGTGSGCIAITLALEFPQAEVIATDISVRALDVAAGNDMIHEGRVRLVQSNLLRDLCMPEEMRDFDVLVANLPYVDPTWDWVDADNLAFEPRKALFAAAEHGLSFYKRLLRELQSDDVLRVRYLIFEADPCQHDQLVEFTTQKGYDLRQISGYGLLFEKH